MSSVAEIEIAIRRLSVAEQRILAERLGARLFGRHRPDEGTAANEGIRFLPQYDVGPASGGAEVEKRKRPAKATRWPGRRRTSKKRTGPMRRI